ncbi:MAG: holo-ACP synthase [Holosporales bacterium]|jgi:holo-[acyl-carrier protein] synthase|nr:holo-ACP synthase [Holosporales bacterium]
MILGLGSDIVDIRRIERLYSQYGKRLGRLLFTDSEWIASQSASDCVAFLAKRFAAKEAFVKALGTGFGQHGNIVWRDIEVINDRFGKPSVSLCNNALVYMKEITRQHSANEYYSHLSLSDEFPYAIASVLIEM